MRYNRKTVHRLLILVMLLTFVLTDGVAQCDVQEQLKPLISMSQYSYDNKPGLTIKPQTIADSYCMAPLINNNLRSEERRVGKEC